MRRSLLFVVGLIWVGAGACGDERPVLGGGGQGEAPSVAAALRRPRCSAGFVAPASGFLSITEIPTLGGGDITVQDINDSGVAVGTSRGADGNKHAFRYTDVGGVQDLGALPGFGAISYGSGIASDGSISGHSDDGDGTGMLFGYRYTAAGGHQRICPTPCSAWDLNGNGQVVGLIPDVSDATVWQAFVWSASTGLQRLGTLGGPRSSAVAINDAGVVVGSSQLAGAAAITDPGHAFIWDARNGLRDLNAVAAAPAWVLQGANDVGTRYVAGWGLIGGEVHAFTYDMRTRVVRDLGPSPDGGTSVAWGVDARGDAVGWAQHDAHSLEAFVYSPNLGLRRLNDFLDPTAGWNLMQANGLNANGDIVGWGTHQNLQRGFKLTMPSCARDDGGD